MKPYFAYIRVSTAKQGQLGSSLQEQREAILAFAKRNDLSIESWYEDRETAAKKGRTQFMRMMASLEKRQAAGVILHKIDRGARNLWDWARIQDLIDAGVGVHFAHESLDLRSRGGRLAADIQAVVAADYVRNLRDEVRKGMRGRLKQGLYPWKAPVGYLDQGKAKAKIIDPIKGPLVRAAFDLYLSKRYSYASLAVELHQRGLHRRSGKPLALNAISELLHNPFYVGIIRLKRSGETFQGVHEPLIAARTFQAVQGIVASKTNTRCRRFDFAFRRLLTCGLCGRGLTGEVQKGHTYYRCHTRACPTKGIREDNVAREFREMTAAFALGEIDTEEIAPYLVQKEHELNDEQDKVSNALKLRVAAIEERQQRLTDAYLDQALDRDGYEQRRATLLLELAGARDDLKSAERCPGPTTSKAAQFFELLKTLQLSPLPENNEKYREAVEILSSNRSLKRKKLQISLRSPFQELLASEAVLFGAPLRDTFRTCRSKPTRSKKSAALDDQSVHRKRAETLFEYLKDWAPPASSQSTGGEQVTKRKPLPHWFKPKNASRIDDEGRDAA